MTYGVSLNVIVSLRGAWWLSWFSVRLLVSAQVLISWFVSLSSSWGSVLAVWGLVGVLSLPLSPPLPHAQYLSLINFYFIFNVYVFLGQRQSLIRGGAEREGDTGSEAGSRLRAVSTEPDVGLEPTNCGIMT